MKAETVRLGFKIYGTVMLVLVGGGFVYVGLTGGQPVMAIAAGVVAGVNIGIVWWRG